MKRKYMNKNIALIIAAAISVGQIPVNALANDYNTIAIEDVQEYAAITEYKQSYDEHDSNSWTKLQGNGNMAENYDFKDEENEVVGALEIKRTGSDRLVFVEDQSPVLKDFEAETRFQLIPEEGQVPGRFGFTFRGKDSNNFGFVGYDNNGKWLIQAAGAGNYKNNIPGPTVEAGDWVTMKVKLIRNNLVVTVNGEEIINEIVTVNNFPQEAGQFGFATWYDQKDIKVDYMNITAIENASANDVVSIEPITINTLLNNTPELPYKVNVTYSDGTTGEEIVIWDYVDPAQYSEVGTFTVEGKLRGASEDIVKAVANITVREKISYSTDFETEETSGDWKVLRSTGTTVVEDGALKVPMNGVSVAADMASPDVKDVIYETEFTTDSDTGRIGLGFRIKDGDNWGAVCYDAGSWIWKAMNNGTGSYGSFPGSFKIEANTKYKLKVAVEGNKITLWANDELIGSTSSDKIPTEGGKVGLAGWFANKTVTLDNVVVEEITAEEAEVLPEVQEQTIASETMNVILDNTFPRVIRYEWKDDSSVLVGQENRYNKIEINNKKYSPVVDVVVEGSKATYTMAIEELDVVLTSVMSVDGNKLRMEITNIEENGDFKVKTVSLPNHSFATVRSDEGGAIAAVLSTGAWHQITDEISTVEDLEPSQKAKTYAFMNNDSFAIAMNNNVIEYSSRILLNTENKNGYKTTSMGTGAWTYREVLESAVDVYTEDTLWTEVIITKDNNGDDNVDWQDAAIEYRNNIEAPMGGEYIKDSLSYIAFNIGYTQSPFLRTLDTVKKIYNYTDGFGQMVLEKGYQGEGHDDVIPDYGGHIGIRQGGVEDFRTLIEEGAKYKARFGVHINATEYQKDAFEYPQEIVNENSPGWNWLDRSYYVDQRADVVSGELFRRLDMLKEDLPDLGWVYVDVYTGNGWNAHQLGEKLNDLGYQVATEFHSPLEEHVTWTHWGADPAYPNKGGTSEILRFVRNSTKDGFLADPLLKGSKHLLSSGWGGKHSIEGASGIETFYNQVLPTKYMQHFDIMKRTDDEVIFNENLRAVREGANINYYKDGKLVATTPENSISDVGLGKTTLFLEWNFDSEEHEGETSKIYHWNPYGTTSTWDIPDSWENLSNVHVYELTDVGRVKVGTIDVVDGQVTLEVKQNTPYIITQGEATQDRITDWGYGSLIKDNGFDSQTWDSWTKTSEDGNTEHITFVNETHNNRMGNDVVSIANKQGKLSQKISGLEEGKTYSLSVWIDNNNNREVELGINIGGQNIIETAVRDGQLKQGQGVKYLGDTFARMEVEFTVPVGVTTAEVYVDAKAGEGTVIVDDFRIWENPGHTNRDGYVFYEDFENVDEGIAPFYLAPGRGNSVRTHLAEKDLYGRQMMNWVLDGRFSLKSNQQDGESGQMFITDAATFKLEPNTTYELGFLYSLANASANYSVNIKSLTNGTLLNIPLEATNIAVGEYTNAKEVTKTFTTGDKDDYYISVDKATGYQELILDNVYIKEVKEEANCSLKYVNLNTLVNELPVDLSVDFSVNALMSNGDKVDLSQATVEYVISNEDILSIADGQMIGLADGVANVSVNVTVDGETVSSNTVTVKVGEGSKDEEVPPVENVNKQALEIVIEMAEEITEEELSTVVPAVVKEFKAALEEAKAILANNEATQAEVNESFDRLSDAMQMLEFKKGDKVSLIELIGKMDGLNGEEYIASTWNKLKVNLNIANAVVANENAMEEEVSETYTNLLKSFLQLRLKPNKEKLEELINKAEGLDSSKYTRASWRVVERAVEKANDVMNNENATEKEVANAEAALNSAIDNLQLAASNNSTASSSSSSTSKTSKGTLPKTGGRSAAAVGVFGGILATIGAVMFKKRK